MVKNWIKQHRKTLIDLHQSYISDMFGNETLRYAESFMRFSKYMYTQCKH